MYEYTVILINMGQCTSLRKTLRTWSRLKYYCSPEFSAETFKNFPTLRTSEKRTHARLTEGGRWKVNHKYARNKFALHRQLGDYSHKESKQTKE